MLTSGVPADHPALLECCEFLELSPDSEQAMRLITGLGYDVDYRELRACDYGAPTIRKRFFMVMRRDGKPIVWPEATMEIRNHRRCWLANWLHGGQLLNASTGPFLHHRYLTAKAACS